MNKSKYSSKTKVQLIFISFILINIAISMIMYFNLNGIKPNNSIIKSASYEINKKEDILSNYFKHSYPIIESIRKDETFKDYLAGDINAKNLLVSKIKFLLSSHHDIFQIRYIDKNGFEKIRVEKKDNSIFLVKDENLQDKSRRYYFKKALKSKKEEAFFSDIDLNIEYEHIQLPPIPTLRLILPIFKSQNFDGILVINMDIKELLQETVDTEMFDVILSDSNGFVILHYNHKNDWGILSKNINISSEFKEYKYILNNKMFISKNFVSKHIQLPLENKPILIFKTKYEYLKKLQNEYFNKISIMLFSLLILSIIISFVINRIVKKLNLDLFEKAKYQHLLDEYIDMVDKNIITSKTDLDGNITYVSKAFCEISGYTKDELIGQNHSIIRHQDTTAAYQKRLWKTIKKGNIWKGEFKNKTKNNKPYWISQSIKPEYDFNGNKIGYIGVAQNITGQKLVEKLSNTDGLTNLYNKRYFLNIVPRFINNLKRDDKYLCFVILDVDNFKLYNDNYGHLKGDDVLKDIALVLKNNMERFNDFAFRIGGEEFSLVFKSGDYEKAKEYVNKIRTDIENLKIKHDYNPHKYVTVSMGMIHAEASKVKDLTSIFKKADELLYKAKSSGRNIVISSDE